MKINCTNCGKCCYSEIPSSWYKGKMILDYEESQKYPKRDNMIVLSPEEVKLFWDKNLGNALVVTSIIQGEGKLHLLITLDNFPKFINNKWYLCCPFLDTNTKKCKIYNTPFFPNACKEFPFIFINEGYTLSCEPNRITGELTEEQKKLKMPYGKIFSLDLSKKFNLDQIKNLFQEQDNNQVLCSLLYQVYGMPEKLKGQEKIFTLKLFKKVNKEMRFYKENFKKD